MTDISSMKLNFADITDAEATELGITDDTTTSPFKIGGNVVTFGRHKALGTYMLVRNGLTRYFMISEAAYSHVAFE